MTEGLQHRTAVAIVKEELRLREYHIFENNNERGEGGFAFPRFLINDELITYTADIYAGRNGYRMIVEIDGQKPGQGHYSAYARKWDGHRDQFFWDNFGIPTVRLETMTVLNREIWNGAMLSHEIFFQCDYWQANNRPPLR